MGEREIGESLTYLVVEEHVAVSTQNQALGALLFQARSIQSVGSGTEASLPGLAL
jgi:hypothetical protein